MFGGRQKRILVALLIMAVCFAMLTPACIGVAGIHHECSGDGCTVCAALNTLGNAVRTLAAIAAAFSVLFLSVYAGEQAPDCSDTRWHFPTLVTLKVELLN